MYVYYMEHFEIEKITNFNVSKNKYCKATFIRVRDIFVWFARASLSQIFLAENQSLSFACYNNILVWIRLGREQ